MNKIKIIDLLNMISRGEKIPKKVKYSGIIFENKDGDLLNNIDCSLFEHRSCEEEKLLPMLNDEVEIIEEDKKIRKIKVDYSPDIEEKIFYDDGDKPNHCILGDAGTELLINKINEIIDKINKENKYDKRTIYRNNKRF